MVTAEVNESALFRHVTAERAAFYRAIMQVFGAAKRQFRLHLRPDEVRLEAEWPAPAMPALDVVQQALSQLVEWGNLTAQPARYGVLVNELAAPALVFKLNASTDTPLGKLLALACEQHLPVHLSLRNLLRDPPRFLGGQHVFICENPNLNSVPWSVRHERGATGCEERPEPTFW